MYEPLCTGFALKSIVAFKHVEVPAWVREYTKSGTTVTTTVSILVQPPARLLVTSYVVVYAGLATGFGQLLHEKLLPMLIGSPVMTFQTKLEPPDACSCVPTPWHMVTFWPA